MDTAQQKSQALLEEKKKQEQQNGQDGFTDGKMLPSVTEKNPPAKVENPIPVIRKVRKMGLLDLVLPFGKEVSDKKVKTKELVSPFGVGTTMINSPTPATLAGMAFINTDDG